MIRCVPLVLALLCPSFVAAPRAAGDELLVPVEPVRVFRASDLLPAELLRGPNYEIDEEVPLRGYWYDFRLKTKWGDLPARGMGMLELRIREMHAVERARRLSRDPQFVEGVLGNLTAAPRGALIILKEPVSTLKRAPKGLEHSVSPFINKVDRRAGSNTRRRFAAEIDCDPETTNPVLEGLLDQMARRKNIGTMVGKAGLGLALPGLGLLPTTAEFKDAVANKLPHEINQALDRELADLGVDDEVRHAFLHGEQYTTTRRLYYVKRLRSLENVENRAALVSAASQARTESDGMAILREMQMLYAAHAQQPFRRVESIGLPLGIRADGTHVLICPVDHLWDSAEAAQVIATYRQRHPTAPTVLHAAGHVEPEAAARLSQAGIAVLASQP
ncbi:MAG: hypothetical protein WD066_00270 [Planctomycetaceae bacterium]